MDMQTGEAKVTMKDSSDTRLKGKVQRSNGGVSIVTMKDSSDTRLKVAILDSIGTGTPSVTMKDSRDTRLKARRRICS